MFSLRRSTLAVLCCLSLAGCTIHTIDIQQGNVIDEEAINQLELGMSKRQVSFIMGTPLIQDPFHHNRWDYLYTLRPGNQSKITERKRAELYFEADTLVKIERPGS